MNFHYDDYVYKHGMQHSGFLTDRQFCDFALQDLRDSKNKNQALLGDLSLISLSVPFKTDDLTIIGDPVSDTLSDATVLTRKGKLRYLARRSAYKIHRAPSPSTIFEKVSKFYTPTGDDTTIFGKLLRSVENEDPDAATIMDVINNTSYTVTEDEFDTVTEGLDAIDEAVPSYLGEILSIDHEFTHEDGDLCIQELTSRGDLFYVDQDTGEASLLPVCSSMALLKEWSVDATGITDSDEAVSAVLSNIGENLNIQLTGSLDDDIDILNSQRYGAIYDYDGNPLSVYQVYEGYNIASSENFEGILDSLSEVAESVANQTVLINALEILSSGKTNVSDLASRLSINFQNLPASAKELVNTLCSYGSSSPEITASGLSNTYKAISGRFTVLDDGSIQWEDNPTPDFDWSIASVITGVVLQAVQVVGTILAFIPVTRIAGIVMVGAGMIFNAVQNLAATQADTMPIIQTGCIDNVVSVPLLQNEDFLISQLPSKARSILKQYDSCKLVHPYFVVYCYNPRIREDGLEVFTCKIFPTLNLMSSLDGVPLMPELTDNANQPFACLNNSGSSLHATISSVIMNRGLFNSCKTRIRDEGFGILANKADISAFSGRSRDSLDYPILWGALAGTVIYLFWTLISDAPSVTATQSAGKLAVIIPEKTSGSSVEDARQLWAWSEGGVLYSGDTQNFNVTASYADTLTINGVPQWMVVGAMAMFGGSYKRNSYAYQLQKYCPDILCFNPAYGDATATTNEFYQSVITQLSALAVLLRQRPGLAENLFNDPLVISTMWTDIDNTYAIDLPTRSYAALVSAEIVAVVALVVAVAITMYVAPKVKRKLQPYILKNVARAEGMNQKVKDDIDFLNTYGNQFPQEEVNAAWKQVNAEVKAYYKQVRHFNLVTSLLGMGGFDASSGFWEGPSTIGGNWGSNGAGDSSFMETISALGSTIKNGIQNVISPENDDISINELYKVITGHKFIA